MNYTTIKKISNFDAISFRGDFKMNNTKGSPTIYSRGDVVLYEGKTFIANETVFGVYPTFDKEQRWYCLAGSAVYVQSDVPPSAKNGDEWFNSSSGRLYRYLQDASGEQWVEI
tara:strand:- start:21046 stop:21384 length:339 start_codon:yes stop_codon:yes gene_type:complete